MSFNSSFTFRYEKHEDKCCKQYVYGNCLFSFDTGATIHLKTGRWTREEDNRLRKNWNKYFKVCSAIFILSGTNDQEERIESETPFDRLNIKVLILTALSVWISG